MYEFHIAILQNKITKTVLMLSTFHFNDNIDLVSEDKRRPDNLTKGGVDCVQILLFLARRIFHTLLDVAEINAHVISI